MDTEMSFLILKTSGMDLSKLKWKKQQFNSQDQYMY